MKKRYQIRTFKNADRSFLIFELRKFTAHSRVGLLVSTKAIHRSASLASFRAARVSLTNEANRMGGVK